MSKQEQVEEFEGCWGISQPKPAEPREQTLAQSSRAVASQFVVAAQPSEPADGSSSGQSSSSNGESSSGSNTSSGSSSEGGYRGPQLSLRKK